MLRLFCPQHYNQQQTSMEGFFPCLLAQLVQDDV